MAKLHDVRPAAPALGTRQKSILLLCASAASSLIMLDSNIVAVALPSIARDLHAVRC